VRPKYHDLEPGDFGEQLDPYDFVELKYDGLYAEFVGDANGWSIHGRNGRLIRYGEEPCPECYLRGEFIADTEWAEGSELYGSFVAWDCVYWRDHAPDSFGDGAALLCKAKREIHDALREAGKARYLQPKGVISHSMCWPVSLAAEIWETDVMHGGWEGLIFRSADGKRFGRMKRVVTVDYVVTGVRRKGPCVTAIHGGLHVHEFMKGPHPGVVGLGKVPPRRILETVVTVPVKAAAEQRKLGRQPDLIGRVFEAAGNAVLKSGALRHPRQAGKGGAVLWRPDKAAGECKL